MGNPRSSMLSATIVSAWLDGCWARVTLEIPGLDLRAVLGEQWQRLGCGAPSCVLLRSSESRYGCRERHRCRCYRYAGEHSASCGGGYGEQSGAARPCWGRVSTWICSIDLGTALHLVVLQGGKNFVRLLVKCGWTGVGRIHYPVASGCVWRRLRECYCKM